MSIPAVCITGWANSGKTTLIEGLIGALSQKGLIVGVVKHDTHGAAMDKEGKDTWRFTRAGARVSAISSPGMSAFIESAPLCLSEMLSRVRGVDIILVEGFDKEACLPMLEVTRDGAPLRAPQKWLRAAVTDAECALGVPVFAPGETEKIADFVLALAREQAPEKGDESVSVEINGSQMHIVPFVERVISSVCRGLIGTLDGYADGCDITIRIPGDEKRGG